MAALEYATGVVAEVVGKPQASFFHQAIEGLPGAEPANTVMVGDVSRNAALCYASDNRVFSFNTREENKPWFEACDQMTRIDQPCSKQQT